VKRLSEPDVRRQVIERLRLVRADTPRRWGRMTAPQMVCHLSDSFRGLLGEREGDPMPPRPRWLQLLVRGIALHSPLPWPRGLPTTPAVDSEVGGTRPGEFARDVADLEALAERFVAPESAAKRRPHFAFGTLSEKEWARWAYKHMDHHLRQFGV
jgi:uncharacterized protein DUF1569